MHKLYAFLVLSLICFIVSLIMLFSNQSTVCFDECREGFNATSINGVMSCARFGDGTIESYAVCERTVYVDLVVGGAFLLTAALVMTAVLNLGCDEGALDV